MYSMGALLQMDFVNDASLGDPHDTRKDPPHRGDNRSSPREGFKTRNNTSEFELTSPFQFEALTASSITSTPI